MRSWKAPVIRRQECLRYVYCFVLFVKKSGLILVVLMLAALAGWGWLRQRQAPGRPRVSGAIETDIVQVGSRYGGRVKKLFAVEGDTLQSGQLIAELEASELEPQRAQTAALLAELEAGPRAEEIAAAKSEWQAQSAQLDFARIEAKRAGELFEKKAIAETDRDRAVSQALALGKSVAAAKSRYDLLLAGTRREQIDRAKAQLAEVESHIRELRVAASSNAVVEVLPVRVGDMVPPNGTVATLLLLDHLWVRVYVPEPWLGAIRLGEKVEVQVDSFPGRKFEGVVEQINRGAEFTPRNAQTVGERVKLVFGVKVRLPTGDGALRAGMAADVFFPGIAQ